MSLNKDSVAFEELASEMVALKGDRPSVLVGLAALTDMVFSFMKIALAHLIIMNLIDYTSSGLIP
jgi:hypothetical protein